MDRMLVKVIQAKSLYDLDEKEDSKKEQMENLGWKLDDTSELSIFEGIHARALIFYWNEDINANRKACKNCKFYILLDKPNGLIKGQCDNKDLRNDIFNIMSASIEKGDGENVRILKENLELLIGIHGTYSCKFHKFKPGENDES